MKATSRTDHEAALWMVLSALAGRNDGVHAIYLAGRPREYVGRADRRAAQRLIAQQPASRQVCVSVATDAILVERPVQVAVLPRRSRLDRGAQPVPPRPSIVIRIADARVAIWALTEPMTPGEAELINRLLARKLAAREDFLTAEAMSDYRVEGRGGTRSGATTRRRSGSSTAASRPR